MRRMARGVAMGDHAHMAQGLPVGTIDRAVTRALAVQNIQAAFRLLGTGVDHDQGFPLPDRVGIRAHLDLGVPEVEVSALKVLRAPPRAPGLEAEMARGWDDRMGGISVICDWANPCSARACTIASAVINE